MVGFTQHFPLASGEYLYVDEKGLTIEFLDGLFSEAYTYSRISQITLNEQESSYTITSSEGEVEGRMGSSVGLGALGAIVGGGTGFVGGTVIGSSRSRQTTETSVSSNIIEYQSSLVLLLTDGNPLVITGLTLEDGRVAYSVAQKNYEQNKKNISEKIKNASKDDVGKKSTFLQSSPSQEEFVGALEDALRYHDKHFSDDEGIKIGSRIYTNITSHIISLVSVDEGTFMEGLFDIVGNKEVMNEYYISDISDGVISVRKK
ncbi:MAG: hypothetical protein ACQ9ET_01700 [Nitrosomonadaceae bacterium]